LSVQRLNPPFLFDFRFNQPLDKVA